MSRVAGAIRAALARLLVAGVIVAAGSAAAARAQEAAEPASPQTSSEVRLFLDLLGDPEVRAWIEEQRKGAPAAAAAEAGSEPMM